MRITIIGAGPGGYETAVAAAKKGFEVTIISHGPVGGTCLNEGCISTKCLCRNASLLDDLSDGEAFGLNGLTYTLDFSKVMERKKGVVSQLKSGVEFLLKGKNIELVMGKASFVDEHTVKVSSDDPETDGKEIVSDYIIIATGSYSASLPIEGADIEGVISSKEMLSLSEIPQRLCVIGAGVIGLEFASIFKSFGSEVTVVEYFKDILPRFDTDLSKRLKQTLTKKRGIAIETEASVKKISAGESGLEVSYTKKDKEFTVTADKVLMAVGRRPNVGAVNLDDIGIEYTPKGIKVDAEMRTNIPHIFAIGDVTGGMMLAHVATFQGFKALAAIAGEQSDIDLSIVPAAVFTNPEAGTVGLTEDECKTKGIPVHCLKSFFRANGKALSLGESDGYCKIVVADGSEGYKPGQILGCHLFGAHSADIVQEISALMKMKATVDDMKSMIHAHPTLSEVLQSAIHS